MIDVHSPEQRRRNMAAIRGKNTKPEIRVRGLLHSLGYRYRLYYPLLPGKPDIVLPRFRAVIFVHGCFWHRHGCRYGRVVPATRANFWEEKRIATSERDKVKARALRKMGWKVFVIWECKTRDKDTLNKTLQQIITSLKPASLKQNFSKLRVRA